MPYPAATAADGLTGGGGSMPVGCIRKKTQGAEKKLRCTSARHRHTQTNYPARRRHTQAKPPPHTNVKSGRVCLGDVRAPACAAHLLSPTAAGRQQPSARSGLGKHNRSANRPSGPVACSPRCLWLKTRSSASAAALSEYFLPLGVVEAQPPANLCILPPPKKKQTEKTAPKNSGVGPPCWRPSQVWIEGSDEGCA